MTTEEIKKLEYEHALAVNLCEKAHKQMLNDLEGERRARTAMRVAASAYTEAKAEWLREEFIRQKQK